MKNTSGFKINLTDFQKSKEVIKTTLQIAECEALETFVGYIFLKPGNYFWR